MRSRYGGAVSLEGFSPAVRAWFESTFETPTAAQAQGWPAIAGGRHSLILAPTGSGKTLAAFLWALDRLMTDPPPPTDQRCRVLYISPLRALAVDIEKNLRTPLTGIGLAAERLGEHVHEPRVAMRTGDTSASERRRIQTRPPDVLITTPESLYLMLTSQAREILRSVRWVIVDEIHAMAGSKRGAHLALSLERLEELAHEPPQRIGLSATQRPLEEIARFLGGQTSSGPRPVTIVDAGLRKPMEIEVVVPVEDMADLSGVSETPQRMPAMLGPATPGTAPPQASIWPAIHPQVLELIRAHRSTIVFVNARRLAERLAARLNELAGEELARAHHGSIAREQRLEIEDQLKRGTLKAIVATSSLELGIDMGAVDLVIQVESPGSVARGLQRIGRAGHQVGEPSRGKVFPKFRGDLLEATVVVQRMLQGAIEETHYPRNPLDVVAQQIVAMCAMDEWTVADLGRVLRRAANFEELSDELLRNVLDLLAGRYPSDEFAELRPRIVWDRRTDTLRGREGAGRLAIASGGTIPDRGLFGVFTVDGRRVGELDEEMVYESRRGEVFMLGASSWRIEDITLDRVVVSPAPGEPGKMPFWHGDKPGRPLELGRAIGVATRELSSSEHDVAVGRLRTEFGLDELAAENLTAYLEDQREATGAVPDDRTIVVERFPDEIGDWRVCVLSPFGERVHAPWAMAIEGRLAERYGLDVQVLWSDDGIAIRLPESEERIPVEDLLFDPDEIEELVVARLPGTALFTTMFREAAARALLLPRRTPGRRTPLWQQRQRGADLLEVASRHPTFPILLEATREVLRDVFDVPGLKEVLGDVRARRIHVVPVDTTRSSPFAQSLLFRWVSVYMYEADAPMAERRAAALSLDRELLRELLGAEDLRELIDPVALAELELELQHLAEGRRARNADDVHDLLRRLGDLTAEEVSARSNADPTGLARRSRTRRARDPPAGRRAGAVRRRRGRGAVPGRARRVAPVGRADGVHRTHARTARGPGRAVRADPRTVRDRRRRGAVRRGRGSRRRRGRLARVAGARGPWRVPSRRARTRVVRRGRAALDPPAFAGRAAQGGRAGRGAGARAVRARVAGRDRAAARPDGARRRDRAAAGRLDPRLDRRVRGPAFARAGVSPGRSRRALRERRRRVDGRRRHRRRRRADRARVPRDAPARGPAAPRDAPGGPGARRAPRTPARTRRVVLARAARRGRRPRRTHRALGAVGPGLGGRDHQRHDRTDAGVPDPPPGEGRPRRRQATAGSAPARRAARGRRALVARADAARTRALADRGRARPRDAAPRTPRRAHARGGPGRGRARWVRRRVRGAARARGVGQGPARVLRRRPGRGAVRAPRRGRTDPRPPRGAAGPVRRRARRGGPGPAVRGGPALAPDQRAALADRRRLRRARGRRAGGVPRARRPDPADVRGGRGRRRGSTPSPHWSRTAGCGGSSSRRIDGEPAGGSAFAEDLRTAGFVDGYRGLVLRGS